MQTFNRTDAIQLDATSNRDGVVVVTSKDQDRFLIRVERAAKVLQLADKLESFQRQFQLFARTVGDWLKKPVVANAVASCFITTADGGLRVILTKENARYNEALEDAIADFEIQLSNDIDLDRLNIDIVALPPASQDAIDQFIDKQTLFSLK